MGRRRPGLTPATGSSPSFVPSPPTTKAGCSKGTTTSGFLTRLPSSPLSLPVCVALTIALGTLVALLMLPGLLRLDEVGVTFVPGYPANEIYLSPKVRCIHGARVASTSSTA